MKYIFRTLLCILFAAQLGACKKDTDQNKGSADGTLHFRGFSEEQILLWVGGEQRSPDQIDFSKLLYEDQQSWISEEYYQQTTFFFDGDSLNIYTGEESAHRFGYYFSSDSLFIMASGIMPGTYFPHLTGIGSETELRRKQGLSYVRTYREDGTVKKGSHFNVSDYNTPESMIGMHEFQGIDQMGENDTLLLLNQTKLYN